MQSFVIALVKSACFTHKNINLFARLAVFSWHTFIVIVESCKLTQQYEMC